jgi:hypothetical protein
MKIPIKKYVMDESLSWEERYKQLDQHHKEETEFLISKVKQLQWKYEDGLSDTAISNLQIKGLNPSEREWLEKWYKVKPKFKLWNGEWNYLDKKEWGFFGGKYYIGFVFKSGWHIMPFNLLDKEYRYWGYENLYHDGDHPTFGFGFFNISWGW